VLDLDAAEEVAGVGEVVGFGDVTKVLEEAETGLTVALDEVVGWAVLVGAMVELLT